MTTRRDGDAMEEGLGVYARRFSLCEWVVIWKSENILDVVTTRRGYNGGRFGSERKAVQFVRVGCNLEEREHFRCSVDAVSCYIYTHTIADNVISDVD